MDEHKQELIEHILDLFDELKELRQRKQEITLAFPSTQETPQTAKLLPID